MLGAGNWLEERAQGPSVSQDVLAGTIRYAGRKTTPLTLQPAWTTCTLATGSGPACMLTRLPSLNAKEIFAAGEWVAKAISNTCFHMEINASFKLLQDDASFFGGT